MTELEKLTRCKINAVSLKHVVCLNESSYKALPTSEAEPRARVDTPPWAGISPDRSCYTVDTHGHAHIMPMAWLMA